MTNPTSNPVIEKQLRIATYADLLDFIDSFTKNCPEAECVCLPEQNTIQLVSSTESGTVAFVIRHTDVPGMANLIKQLDRDGFLQPSDASAPGTRGILHSSIQDSLRKQRLAQAQELRTTTRLRKQSRITLLALVIAIGTSIWQMHTKPPPQSGPLIITNYIVSSATQPATRPTTQPTSMPNSEADGH